MITNMLISVEDVYKRQGLVASYLHLILKALDNGVPCNYDTGKPLLQAARAGGSCN